MASEKDLKRHRKDSKDDSGYMCNKCDFVSDRAVYCAGCKLSFCLTCAKISRKLYECIKDDDTDSFHWTCRSCTSMFPSLQTISDSLQTITARHESRMTTIESRMDNLEQVTKDEVKTQVSSMKDDIISSLKSDINSMVDARNSELEDRKRRELNLTVFNLAEKNFPSGGDNKRADETDIINISSSLGLEGLNIVLSYRLGAKDDLKIRPLKVILDSKSQRKYILENARFIPTKAEAKYKNVIITKDLTKQQRTERREQIRQKKANRQADRDKAANSPVRHPTASMEVDRPLPSPIPQGSPIVPRLPLQRNLLNDSSNSLRSLAEPTFAYERSTIMNDSNLAGDDITVLGGEVTNSYLQPNWPPPGQPNHP